ncbi:MAG TPA: hypothetical protein PLA97_22645 [Rubrivivax sp.]|nr:hypothetical protein [Rubrivivax sp.]
MTGKLFNVLVTDIMAARSTLQRSEVRAQLKQLGMTDRGIQQLAGGQMPADPADQKLVAAIVAKALAG